MTTFQDPQPQSRRAVRQSERSDSAGDSAVEPQPGFTQSPAPAAPQYYSDPSASGDMWDTTARRAAQLPPAAPRQDAAPAASGRRAAEPPAQPTPVAEPLGYATQQRPPVPTYDGPSFANAPVPAPEPQLPPTQAIPQGDRPAYRVRDFSPEGRRAAPASQPEWTAPSTGPVVAPASDLEYHTEGRVTPLPVAQVPPAPAPVAPPVVPVQHAFTSDVPVEHTLSRRELRAMQQPEATTSENPAVAPQPAAYVAPALVEPVSTPAPVQQFPVEQAPVAETPAEPAPELSPFDALFQPQSAQAPAEPAPFPVQAVEDAIVQPGAVQPGVAEPAAAQQPAPVLPERVLPPVAPEPEANTGLTRAINEFDSLTRAPEQTVSSPEPEQTPNEYVSNEPGTWTPPVGHWSTQADLDDELPESTINRTIGSGSTATNALVVPIPLGNDIRGPLTSTGEIMLTGSIELPRTLATTGQSDRFDSDGIDALFDLSDHEVVATDSAPVRAVTAVSTHSSGHGVTHTQKPKGTRALTALIIAAVSMGVVVVGLLVAAVATNLF